MLPKRACGLTMSVRSLSRWSRWSVMRCPMLLEQTARFSVRSSCIAAMVFGKSWKDRNSQMWLMRSLVTDSRGGATGATILLLPRAPTGVLA